MAAKGSGPHSAHTARAVAGLPGYQEGTSARVVQARTVGAGREREGDLLISF